MCSDSNLKCIFLINMQLPNLVAELLDLVGQFLVFLHDLFDYILKWLILKNLFI